MRISFYLFVSPGCASLALWVRCDSGWVWTCSRRPWWWRPSSNCTTKYGCKIMADTDILLSKREVSDWANDWTLQELQPLAFADNCQSGNQSYFPCLSCVSCLSCFSCLFHPSFLILLSPMQSYVLYPLFLPFSPEKWQKIGHGAYFTFFKFVTPPHYLPNSANQYTVSVGVLGVLVCVLCVPCIEIVCLLHLVFGIFFAKKTSYMGVALRTKLLKLHWTGRFRA